MNQHVHNLGMCQTNRSLSMMQAMHLGKGCKALMCLFSRFHWGCRLSCSIGGSFKEKGSSLWTAYSSLDSGLPTMAVKVSKSRNNSITKPLVQNSPISFEDNIALSLHCTFQSLIFSGCEDTRDSFLAEWLTNSLTHLQTHTTTTVCLGAPPTEA